MIEESVVIFDEITERFYWRIGGRLFSARSTNNRATGARDYTTLKEQAETYHTLGIFLDLKG